jgi:lactate dehydrogenase-like 2-hydroxyacid dehydrogenase
VKNTIAILGLGEVGVAIKKIAKKNGWKVLVRDIYKDEIKNTNVACLHVCVPFGNESFYTIIEEAIADCDPALVLIHSTIPQGQRQNYAKK